MSLKFGDPPEEYSRPATSRVALLPAPLERTTSYGKGTAKGPAAILAASQHLELYDEELGREPYTLGIATLPAVRFDSLDLEEGLHRLELEAARQLEGGKFLVTLGGEHTLTLPLVRATRKVRGDVAVVQFDAHADLRAEYEGNPYSHACVMRRVLDEGLSTCSVGIRSLSTGEAKLIQERSLPVIWGWQLDSGSGLLSDLLAPLPDQVYLTFDVDFLDPSLVPATGTPEPGGGSWYPTLRLLRTLFEQKTVVAMDVVELAPIAGQPASDFVVARLIYKCLGYLQASR